MIITAGSLLKALYVVHWLVWRVPRAKPAGLAPKLALIGLAVAGSALGVAVNDVRTSAGAAGAVLAVLLTTGLSFGGWWWVSWKLPHAPVRAAALIPGAVLMAIGADVLQLLTTYWIGNLIARKTSTYGAVGIALAVLLWVYILGRIMVGSAGLNAALYYRRENRTGQAGRGQLASPDRVVTQAVTCSAPAALRGSAKADRRSGGGDDSTHLVRSRAWRRRCGRSAPGCGGSPGRPCSLSIAFTMSGVIYPDETTGSAPGSSVLIPAHAPALAGALPRAGCLPR